LDSAERWATDALHAARSRSGLALPDGDPRVDTSLLYGADGIRLVRVLIAKSRDRRRSFEARARAFVAAQRRTRVRPFEFLFGRAGQLAGTLCLLDATSDSRFESLAFEQARGLLGPTTARVRPAWTRAPNLGFAHGRAGVFHALLRFHRATGSALPSWFFAELDRLADDVSAAPWPERAEPRATVLARSFCNGAAGLTLLWASAFECTRRARYWELARTGLEAFSAIREGGPGNLCCGLAGYAYAFLAVDRALGSARSLSQAGPLALAAIEQMDGRWPFGLLKGYPGLVCLALDLGRGREPRGFPLVEA
jgi:serine/threonine-protein kinase